MNHLGDIAQLITAIVLAATFIQSFLNGRKSAKILESNAKISENVATIEKATNSMKDALVQATSEAALAKGTAAGIIEGRAAGLDQGRNEERKNTP